MFVIDSRLLLQTSVLNNTIVMCEVGEGGYSEVGLIMAAATESDKTG